MATQNDKEQYYNLLLKLKENNTIKTALYIGIREKEHMSITKTITADIKTLDINSEYQPDIVHDLGSNDPIPFIENIDLVICANTLMYIPNSITAIDKLIYYPTKYCIIQEPVVRPRTEVNSLYKDINRFYCKKFKDYSSAFQENEFLFNADKEYDKNFINIDHSSLVESIYYNNPGPTTLGGLWLYQR